MIQSSFKSWKNYFDKLFLLLQDYERKTTFI